MTVHKRFLVVQERLEAEVRELRVKCAAQAVVRTPALQDQVNAPAATVSLGAHSLEASLYP